MQKISEALPTEWQLQRLNCHYLPHNPFKSLLPQLIFPFLEREIGQQWKFELPIVSYCLKNLFYFFFVETLSMKSWLCIKGMSSRSMGHPHTVKDTKTFIFHQFLFFLFCFLLKLLSSSKHLQFSSLNLLKV